MLTTDVRVRELEVAYTPCVARTALKFGAVVIESLDLATVRAVVETRDGRLGEGWGSIFVMDGWGWPDPELAHELKASAMRQTQATFCETVVKSGLWGHPISLFHELEPALLAASRDTCAREGLAPGQPVLSALVCASPVDAAIHDAYGVANGIGVYDGYGVEFMESDLATWLGPEFRGRYPGEFLRPEPERLMPVFHLCGGLDKLTRSELDGSEPDDGLPNCLEDWVTRDGLDCIKVKLRGSDLDWDIERTLAVHAVAQDAWREGGGALRLTLDTNEQCEDPRYMVEMLERVRERSAACYDAILYVEQPTGRDLDVAGHDMRELSRLKPVIVDESLVDVASFERALALGWSGVALKTCKCQSADAVFWSLAAVRGVPLTVQDLTNPSLALLQSVGLASRLPTMLGVEANSRQFFPAATQESERAVHGAVVNLRGGRADTTSLQGPGFGYQMERLRELGWEPGERRQVWTR